MSDLYRKEITDKEWEDDWNNIWLPLLYTDGQLDLQKIKNEMHDLWFVYQQVGKVYCELTGDKLSKTNYYADVIIGLHNEEVQNSYDEGYSDASEDLKEK